MRQYLRYRSELACIDALDEHILRDISFNRTDLRTAARQNLTDTAAY